MKTSTSLPLGELSRSISMSPEHQHQTSLPGGTTSGTATSGHSSGTGSGLQALKNLTLNTQEANEEASKDSVNLSGNLYALWFQINVERIIYLHDFGSCGPKKFQH